MMKHVFCLSLIIVLLELVKPSREWPISDLAADEAFSDENDVDDLDNGNLIAGPKEFLKHLQVLMDLLEGLNREIEHEFTDNPEDAPLGRKILPSLGSPALEEAAGEILKRHCDDDDIKDLSFEGVFAWEAENLWKPHWNDRNEIPTQKRPLMSGVIDKLKEFSKVLFSKKPDQPRA